MPSFSSKPATSAAASARSASLASPTTRNCRAPTHTVAAVATTTKGAATTKNRTKLMPAVVPTMMLGTDEMSVSRPPTLVSRPSINRKPSSLSRRRSLSRLTAVSDPTMIMAVTLFSTAEKTTVIRP